MAYVQSLGSYQELMGEILASSPQDSEARTGMIIALLASFFGRLEPSEQDHGWYLLSTALNTGVTFMTKTVNGTVLLHCTMWIGIISGSYYICPSSLPKHQDIPRKHW